jgi:hypothetical protein
MTAGGKMIREMAGNGSPVFGDQNVAILLVGVGLEGLPAACKA